MKLLLAVVCFITMLLHAFFGYYLYTQGENVFYPESVKAMLLEVIPQQPNVQPPAAHQALPTHPAAPAALEAPKPAPAAPAANPESPASQPQEAPKPEQNSASLGLPYQSLGSVEGLLSSTASAQENNTHMIEDFKMDDFGAKYRAIMETLGITPLLQAPNPPVDHPSFITGWSGYLQIQNALITTFLFILGISVCCVGGRGSASRWVFATNFFYWISLGCFTWFWHPINTPLAVVRLNFSFPGWYFIVGLSMFAALLSLLLFFAAMRSKEIPLKKGTPDIVKKEIEESKLPPNVKKEVEAVAEEASRADPAAAQFAGQVVEGEQETKRSIMKEVSKIEKEVKSEVSKVEKSLGEKEEPQKEEEHKKGVFSFGRKEKKKEAALAATATATATAAASATTPSETEKKESDDKSESVKTEEAKPDDSLTEKVTEKLKDFADEARKEIDEATSELKESVEGKKSEKKDSDEASADEHPIVDTGSKVLRNLQNDNGIKENDSVIVTPPPSKD